MGTYLVCWDVNRILDVIFMGYRSKIVGCFTWPGFWVSKFMCSNWACIITSEYPKIELELSHTSGWLRAARHGVRFPSGGDIFLTVSIPALLPLSSGYWAFTPRVKRPGLEANTDLHSLPCLGMRTFIPPFLSVSRGVKVIKLRDICDSSLEIRERKCASAQTFISFKQNRVTRLKYPLIWNSELFPHKAGFHPR